MGTIAALMDLLSPSSFTPARYPLLSIRWFGKARTLALAVKVAAGYAHVCARTGGQSRHKLTGSGR